MEWRDSIYWRSMARRCLESKILNSDKFTNLPITSQILYIFLNLEADNYGFIGNTKNIIKQINGASSNDLENLIEEGFILKLSKDVFCITHWFIHNKEDKRLEPIFQEYNLVEIKNKQYVLKPNAIIDDGKYHYLPSDY